MLPAITPRAQTDQPTAARRPLDREHIQKSKGAFKKSTRPLGHQRSVEIDNIAINHDNLARGSWRRGKAPDAHFRLPRGCERLYQNLGVKSHGRQAQKTDTPDHFVQILNQIGLHTGAYIQIPTSAFNPELRIWGEPGQVEEVKRRLRDWISEKKAELGSTWAKSYAPLTERQTRELEAQLQQEAFKERFRKDPHESEVDLITVCQLSPITSQTNAVRC